MTDDEAQTLRQADSLYQGIPDFADWPSPADDDLDLWDRFASRLNEMRAKATPAALQKSVEVAVRAAAMDTGAIEGLYTVDRGFTMTVATQAFAWEHTLDEKGEDVRALFEAQLEAYELVIDAVTKKLPITEAWIRALHEKVCAGQPTYKVLTDQGWQKQELARGAYKSHPNHVLLPDGSIYPYAPVDRVSPEMFRLLEQIRTLAFENAHPIAQASYLHYGFVVIHPFADGNGRVARALASVFFYRALSIPFLVFANQKPAYRGALQQADLGQTRPLLTFFRDRGIDTMQLVIDHLLTVQAPALEGVAAQIRLDDTALRIIPLLREEMKTQTGRLGLPDRLSVRVTPYPDTFPPLVGYRTVAYGESGINVSIQDKSHEASRYFRILVTDDETNPFAFMVDYGAREDRLEIRLDDAYPEISDNLRIRMSNWVRRYLASLLEEWRRHEVPFWEDS